MKQSLNQCKLIQHLIGFISLWLSLNSNFLASKKKVLELQDHSGTKNKTTMIHKVWLANLVTHYLNPQNISKEEEMPPEYMIPEVETAPFSNYHV